MRKTTNSVLEINKLLKEVRPLAAEEPTNLPLHVIGVDHPDEVISEVIEEDIFHDAVTEEHHICQQEIPIHLSCVELRQSVADFLEICLQELHDLT